MPLLVILHCQFKIFCSILTRFIILDLSPEQQEELKGLYRSLSELLRHFWAAFPPSSPELVQKLDHMINVLHKFNQV